MQGINCISYCSLSKANIPPSSSSSLSSPGWCQCRLHEQSPWLTSEENPYFLNELWWDTQGNPRKMPYASFEIRQICTAPRPLLCLQLVAVTGSQWQDIPAVDKSNLWWQWLRVISCEIPAVMNIQRSCRSPNNNNLTHCKLVRLACKLLYVSLLYFYLSTSISASKPCCSAQSRCLSESINQSVNQSNFRVA